MLALRDPAANRHRTRRPGSATEATRGESGARAILCRTCRTRLSDPGAVFPMKTGGATGVFMNPHGFLHEVVTVRRAENIVHLGWPTTDFSWFPGYAWEIALCAACREHVGWRFTPAQEAEPAVFWGLRRPAIIEDEEP